MFYLTTHSTHFIYGYMASDIWLRTILIEKGNPLPPHRLLLSINSKGSFYMHHTTDRITHTTAFVTQVVEHWLEREIALIIIIAIFGERGEEILYLNMFVGVLLLFFFSFFYNMTSNITELKPHK